MTIFVIAVLRIAPKTLFLFAPAKNGYGAKATDQTRLDHREGRSGWDSADGGTLTGTTSNSEGGCLT